MPSKLIYNESNWLFEDPQKNSIHDITIDDINQLLNYADQDDAWAKAVKNNVVEREKAIRSGTYTKKTDWLLEEYQITQTSGTVIRMPFGLRIITFPSKRQLFRGEVQNYHASIKNESPISRVKYVNSNSILAYNVQNQVFKKFINFVERMLLFYSLDSRGYEGFMNGTESVAAGIVNSGKVNDFQEFLKENDIEYDLYGCEVDGRKAIYCRFDNKDADFFKIASTGTKSLALFYYWYIRMKEASFVFIDEFDAFYHYELSESVEKRLRRIMGVQIFTTTHNINLMSNDLLRPDSYFLLKHNSIKPISELTKKELRQAHNLQKMYKAGAFDG